MAFIKHRLTLLGCIAVIMATFSFAGKVNSKTRSANGWENLLDNNMSKWRSYLSYSFSPDYSGKKPVNENGTEIAPVGYDKDVNKVFSVIKQNGEPVLKVSGTMYGCLFTKQEYENYHFKIKVKWGVAMYGPRIGKLKDSGILYDSQGEAGVDYWRSWMLSQEFQIMPGHIGDYWNIANSAVEIRAFLSEGKMNSVADAGQPFLPFGTGNAEGLCLKGNNYENPQGEWNTLELINYKGKSLHIVNGHVVMILRNSRFIVNGKTMPLIKGKIQLQSEGSEVYYKDIQIKKIDAMPDSYVKYFN